METAKACQEVDRPALRRARGSCRCRVFPPSSDEGLDASRERRVCSKVAGFYGRCIRRAKVLGRVPQTLLAKSRHGFSFLQTSSSAGRPSQALIFKIRVSY